jgi:hypothetical protein
LLRKQAECDDLYTPQLAAALLFQTALNGSTTKTLIGAIESGKYDDISVNEVKAAIDNHMIFSFLQDRLGRDYFSGLTQEKKTELNEDWEALNNVTTAEEFGVTRRGICLILAYLLEGIQSGTSRDGRRPEHHPR